MRSDGTRIGLGGTLAALGGAGLVALCIYAAEAAASSPDRPSAWGETWFQVLFGTSAALAVLGAYILTSVMIGLPFPATRLERIMQPRLTGTEARAARVDGTDVVFQIGTYNAGRANVDGAMVNVVVPEYINELHRCSENGEIGRPEHKGGCSGVPESLVPGQPDLGSIYWNGNVSYPGRTHRVVYFRAVMSEPRGFPMRLEITSPELDESLERRFDITVADLVQGAGAAEAS